MADLGTLPSTRILANSPGSTQGRRRGGFSGGWGRPGSTQQQPQQQSGGAPPQQQQTFAQMQQAGLARPAPPPQGGAPQAQTQSYQQGSAQPAGPSSFQGPQARLMSASAPAPDVGSQYTQSVSNALQAPSRYDLPQVQQVRDALYEPAPATVQRAGEAARRADGAARPLGVVDRRRLSRRPQGRTGDGARQHECATHSGAGRDIGRRPRRIARRRRELAKPAKPGGPVRAIAGAATVRESATVWARAGASSPASTAASKRSAACSNRWRSSSGSGTSVSPRVSSASASSSSTSRAHSSARRSASKQLENFATVWIGPSAAAARATVGARQPRRLAAAGGQPGEPVRGQSFGQQQLEEFAASTDSAQ